jgi:hypothetical protein
VTDDRLAQRPPYLWAGATFAAVMAVYIATLAPTTAFWDTSEYIAAAKVLGIPHPPGNPLFTLMAHVWGLLPLVSDYAMRINLFAATTSAAGAALWFLVAERWLQPILPARGPRLAAAFAGILAGATAWTVWNQSTVNEKVYTVSLLSLALSVWFTVRWADEPAGARRDRWLVAAIYVIALSSTNHQMGLLSLPALGVYVLLTDWRVITRWPVLLSFVAVWVVGISINYLYLPIRAAQYPPINEGEPVGFFSQALMDVLNRVQYQKPDEFSQRMSPFSAQLANYWTYWSWQWGRDLGGLRPLAVGLFTALGLGGLWTLLRRNLRGGLAAGALLGTLTLLLIFYLNFKYGFSYRAGDPLITQEMREVRDRDYFYIASFAFFGVLLAAGFAGIIRMIGDAMGPRVDEAKRYLVGTPVLVLALVPLLGNRVSASRADETIARDFAIDILESIEPYGILITAGDNDTFPLWFAQEVLGVRRDVTLANLSLMNTDWHLRQLRRRELPDFDPATAAPIWRPGSDRDSIPLVGAPAGGWQRPRDPVFNLSLAGLDSIPEVVRTPGAGVRFDSLQVTFGAEYLTRSDLATVLLIRDNLGKRPTYFSWSDGNFPDQTLGLTPYLVSHGLVRKLMPAPVKPSGAIVESEALGFVDVERSRALMFGTYHPEAAARKRPFGWVDEPSASILSLYYVVYGGMAPVLRQLGDETRATEADRLAQDVLGNMRLGPR